MDSSRDWESQMPQLQHAKLDVERIQFLELTTLYSAVCTLVLFDGFRFLDTSLCDVDVQPTYVRAFIKGKVCVIFSVIRSRLVSFCHVLN